MASTGAHRSGGGGLPLPAERCNDGHCDRLTHDDDRDWAPLRSGARFLFVRIDLATLPSDIDTLHQLVRDLAAQLAGDQTELAQARSEVERLRLIIQRLQRSQFGRRSAARATQASPSTSVRHSLPNGRFSRTPTSITKPASPPSRSAISPSHRSTCRMAARTSRPSATRGCEEGR